MQTKKTRSACCKAWPLALFLSVPVLTATNAYAQDAWAAVEGRAAVTLPAPTGNPAVLSGALECAEQRWTLKLGLAQGHPTVSGTISFAVDRESFSTIATPLEGAISLPVSHAALEKIKSGIRLVVRLSMEGEDTSFNLRGSRRAIEAAAPSCSPRDMSAYDRIVLAPEGEDQEQAAKLRDRDIKAFRAATSAEPVLASGTLEAGEGQKLLLAQLCGSSWYFGRTGCNLAGFIRQDGSEDWQQVFDGEGTALYADPKSRHSGWPDLIAISQMAAGPAIVWRWDGARYSFLREDMPE